MASQPTLAVPADGTTTLVKKKRPYLHEVDLMRNIFIFGVLLNHTTSAFATHMAAGSWSQLLLHATHLALHFTRMGFMFMTGLVLFLNYYQREHQNWWLFWKKRYTSVGIPYLAWNALLLLIVTVSSGVAFNGTTYLTELYQAVIHGDQFYLYYVFVIFQLYLIFPVLVKLFKDHPQRHLQILIISLAIQLVLLVGIKYWLPGVDRSSWPYWFKSYGMNLIVYQAYFICGAFSAIHYQQVVHWLKAHTRLIQALAGILAVGTVGLYFFNQNVLKLDFQHTEIVHQPYIMFYALVMIALVFLIGLKYADVRTTSLDPAVDHFIKLGSKISFGIYLAQTIPLLLLNGILGYLSYLPAWFLLIMLPLGYLFVLGSAFGISYFCYRVQPFGILIGRPQRRKFKTANVVVTQQQRTQTDHLLTKKI
ncbi:acyltransferase [Lapidilactobacillus bayanensis]|uniref:acyltransferase n=1 Tax=Lapidilactobacillus bayanensis TaxID=2485998 RepID=UPI000F7B9C2D|nr:acyltransferase [Lapidilactobacillus bayanensis]